MSTIAASDPYDYRHLSSVMSKSEFTRHVDGKSNVINALGNAGLDSSLEHVMSFINSTDTHTVMRRSAVGALARFPHKKVSRFYHYNRNNHNLIDSLYWKQKFQNPANNLYIYLNLGNLRWMKIENGLVCQINTSS